VVLVEEPGQLPKTRLFKDGADVGKGDTARLQNLDFAFNADVTGSLTH